ncbi:MAG: zinc ribbon domain-containing protein [Acidobacteriota bacterium]
MFCPKCGCHAGPDGSRFCRNCGFRMDGVAQLLARNGAPEGYVQPPAAVALQPSPRKKGLKKGGKILFGAVAFFPLFFGFCFLVNSGGPLVVPAFVFFAGMMRMLYARIFEDAAPESPTAFQPFVQPVAVPPQPVSFLPGNYQPPLTQQSNVPTTGNLVAPPSVSEPTTNLLKQR